MTQLLLDRNGTVEYKAESTFATWNASGSMAWPGLVQSFKATIKTGNEEYRALKDPTSTTKLELAGTENLGQTLDVDMEYYMQNFKLFQYAMSNSIANTGQTQTLGDSLKSISFGLKSAVDADTPAKFAKVLGCKISNFDVDIPENDKAKATLKLVGAHLPTTSDNPWSSTDYAPGAHATKSTKFPIRWKDIKYVKYNGNVIPNSYVGGIKFGIENKLDSVIDVYGTTSTKIVGIEPDTRDINLTMTLKKKAIDSIIDKAIAFGSGTVDILIGDNRFLFYGARIPQDVVEFAPQGLTSLDVEFAGINNMTMAL